MYTNTRFGDVMKGLSRSSFEKQVVQMQSDKYAKGFRSWDQLVAMVYAQVSGSRSLRELEVGFNAQSGHHYHLGTRSIKRSTLADANAKRSSTLFQGLAEQLLAGSHRKLRQQYKKMLYLLDSTPIHLIGDGYDQWGLSNRNGRTQGLKVHMLYSPDAQLPIEMSISAPNLNDIDAARPMAIEPNATYVFDKGYCDYNWWYKIEQSDACFVTRFKHNAALVELESKLIPEDAKAVILSDTLVRFKYKHPGGQRINHYQKPLRQVVVARPDKPTPLVLATNDLERPAAEIAQLYKTRWQIELFFKWLKQNLKIKRFLGRSKNAVKTQIYVAIISYILLWQYRQRHGIKQSMHLCLASLTVSLFQRPDTEQAIARRQRRHREQIKRWQVELPL
jgi:putative transposase